MRGNSHSTHQVGLTIVHVCGNCHIAHQVGITIGLAGCNSVTSVALSSRTRIMEKGSTNQRFVVVVLFCFVLLYQVSINCPTPAFIPRLPDNNPNSLLTLSDHADLSVLNTVSPSADSYQSSRAYLAATWTVTTLQGLEPVRYEVSAGRSSETSPLGVFDLLEDRVWRDVGLETSSVIAVPAGQSQVLCHCRFP